MLGIGGDKWSHQRIGKCRLGCLHLQDERVNPPYRPEVIPLKLTLDMVPSSSADHVTTRVAWMFSLDGENACKATWAVQREKHRRHRIDYFMLDPPGISETVNDLKIT